MRSWDRANQFAQRWPVVPYLLVVLGTAIALWRVDVAADNAKEQNDKTLGTVIAVQIDNCKSDHQFRVQYRKRGEAEKALLDLFLDLARQNVAEGKDVTGQSQAFINRFDPLAEEIRIIPIPNCERTGDRLRRVIENSEVDIPHIPSLDDDLELPRRVPREVVPNKQPSTGRQQPGPPRGGPQRGQDGTEPGAPPQAPAVADRWSRGFALRALRGLTRPRLLHLEEQRDLNANDPP